MGKSIWMLLLVVLIAGWLGSGCVGPDKSVAKEGLTPTVVAFPAVVKMDKKATVTLIGTGFEPGKKVTVTMVTADGINTEIDYSFEPEPVPGERGTWISEWKDCGRFISEGLVKEGAYAIMVADGEYNVLAHAPIGFFADKKDEKKK
jgi:hypothetical protein